MLAEHETIKRAVEAKILYIRERSSLQHLYAPDFIILRISHGKLHKQAVSTVLPSLLIFDLDTTLNSVCRPTRKITLERWLIPEGRHTIPCNINQTSKFSNTTVDRHLIYRKSIHDVKFFSVHKLRKLSAGKLMSRKKDFIYNFSVIKNLIVVSSCNGKIQMRKRK